MENESKENTIISNEIDTHEEKKSKHKGHVFNETCQCIVCKNIRGKRIKDSLANETNEQKFIDNLPKNKVLFIIDESNLSLMLEKVEGLKEKHYTPNMKYNDFVNGILNSSLTNYLNSL